MHFVSDIKAFQKEELARALEKCQMQRDHRWGKHALSRAQPPVYSTREHLDDPCTKFVL